MDEQASRPPPETEVSAPASETAEQIARLLAERDELNQKYLRLAADYQNSQRRSAREQEEAKRQGLTSVALGVLGVIDHFDLALGQDPEKATAEQIMSGVRVIRDQLLKVLQSYGVTEINPHPGEEFDPHRHQAVMHTESDEIAPRLIVSTLQAGYALGDRVIRPAKVSLRPEADHAGGEG
jgi:molecular chaperone GrpE